MNKLLSERKITKTKDRLDMLSKRARLYMTEALECAKRYDCNFYWISVEDIVSDPENPLNELLNLFGLFRISSPIRDYSDWYIYLHYELSSKTVAYKFVPGDFFQNISQNL